ncbi:MAG: FAD-binding oxidoreductase [Deltaproteobacteria bacterium]|nr:FAD-binding oxidoreductase [Deltaproteobacteria bacterium]
MAELETETIENFKGQIRGNLLTPEDAGYDDARTIWNAMIDRKPALIAECTGVADIMGAVNFARDNDLLAAVRGAGHNIAGKAIADDALMIDLSGLKSVRIDPDSRRAYVGPGATLGDFDHEAQAFGLATPTGINSTTGVAGLTLGGGFGWLSRKYGLTADNLIRADVITAAGNRVVASQNENEDLFWAIRGGGGNFGIVSLFEFQLHPVGPELLAGLVVYPIDQAEAALKEYISFSAQAPDDLTVWAVLRHAPPLPFLPEEVHGKIVLVFAFLYAGDVEAGKQLIDPLRQFGTPYGEHIGPMPYKSWQQAFDPLLTPGVRNYWKSHNFKSLNDSAVDIILEYVYKLPSPHCEIFIAQMGGQTSRLPSDATAYMERDAKFVMNVHARWETPEEDDLCISWARSFFDAAAPHASGGAYINFMTEEEAARVAAVYGPNLKRLSKIKKRYDPDNFFRVNQNIKPAA